MSNRGFQTAGLLFVIAGLSGPVFAIPPVEQRSATAQDSGVLDPSDYGPRGSANVYAGAPAGSSAAGNGKPASGQWELFNQLQQLQEEVQSLRGMVEQQTFEIEQLKKQQRERYLDIDTRLSRMQGANAPAEPAAPADVADHGSSKPPAAVAQGSAAVSGSEKEAYDAAQDSIKAKQYDAAIAQFEAVLSQYPQGTLAPNCHYWLGDLYARKTPPEYDKAQGHFQLLLKNYPANVKVPDALFKMGKLNKDRGDKAKAKAFFERLIASFPQSSAAALARDQLR